MTWDGNKPNTLPRVDDERLAALSRDRTGWELSFGTDAMPPISGREELSLVDEVRAWRKHKLSDDEKAALRELANSADQIQHADAIAAIRRIAPEGR